MQIAIGVETAAFPGQLPAEVDQFLHMVVVGGGPDQDNGEGLECPRPCIVASALILVELGQGIWRGLPNAKQEHVIKWPCELLATSRGVTQNQMVKLPEDQTNKRVIGGHSYSFLQHPL